VPDLVDKTTLFSPQTYCIYIAVIASAVSFTYCLIQNISVTTKWSVCLQFQKHIPRAIGWARK